MVLLYEKVKIDLLVQFDCDIGLFHLFEIQHRLEEIISVPKIDLIQKGAIHPALRERILLISHRWRPYRVGNYSYFSDNLRISPFPHTATAIGLAIAADSMAKVRIRESISHYLGVRREHERGRDRVFDPTAH